VNHHYADIREKLGAPQWWDEHAVPRYCEFTPDATANIYTQEACLLLIECQNCGTEFKVCMSGSDCGFGRNGFEDWRGHLTKAVEDGSLHYGDPPNAGCCSSGPTMTSTPRRVLEFWRMERLLDWQRVPNFERALDCEWAG
jgi:hypothetical protein